MKVSPATLNQMIKVNLLRRPLWNCQTIQDCMDLTRREVMDRIENGIFPFAFNLGNGVRKAEPRVLALSIVEAQLGPLPAIGATRKLSLPQVFDLILPQREIKSTELQRLLSCGNGWFRKTKSSLVITRQPTVLDGPNSYYIVSRASVADF